MKPWIPLVLAAALSLASSPALAVGIDLTWNACVGHPAAATRRDFACTGAVNEEYSLMLQFKLYDGIQNFVGMAAYVDIQLVSGQPLTPFWRYEQGGCNQKGVTLHDALPASCEAVCFLDPWGGDGSEGNEGIAAYGVDFRRPGNGYFILGIARDTPIELLPEQNYFGMELRFNNRNRSTCAGCAERAVLVFQKAELESNDGSPRRDLQTPDKLGQCVDLNGNFAHLYCGITEPPTAVSGLPCDPTPARRPTWRALKMLYR